MRWPWRLALIVGCTKPDAHTSPTFSASAAPSQAPSVVAPADGAVEAAAPVLARCFEPAHITQLGTLKDDKVLWDEDVLSNGKEHFDPETLAVVPAPVHLAQPAQPTDLLATGERVSGVGDMVSAGARWKKKLKPDEHFLRVENGRWVVVGAGDVVMSERVIDGMTGKLVDTRTYVDVRGDLGAATSDDGSSVTVWSLVTHLPGAVKNAGICSAGGLIDWSLTNRFLQCDSNRGGATVHDLRTGKETFVGQATAMSPDERYFVTVPGKGWGENLISADRVTFHGFDTNRDVLVSRDVPPATDSTVALQTTVPVAFCGDGTLFAIVGRREVAVYRGADATRLAGTGAMPGGELLFSDAGRYLVHKRAGAATVFRLDP